MAKKKREGRIPKPKVGAAAGMKPGRQNRKDKRKTSRQLRRMQKSTAPTNVLAMRAAKTAFLTRESDDRKSKASEIMRVKNLLRQLEKDEEAARRYLNPEQQAAAKKRAAEFEKEKEERLFGAARPAFSREPSDHGCGYDVWQCMDMCGDWKNAEAGLDLLAEQGGRLWQFPEARPYCRTLLKLGRQYHLADKRKGGEAVKNLGRLMEVDSSDALCARYTMLAVLMDEGSLGEAKALLDTRPEDKNTICLYTNALIEYITWKVLEDEASTEESARAAMQAAIDANPYVALILCVKDAFMELVNPDVARKIEREWGVDGERGEDGQGEEERGLEEAWSHKAGTVEEAIRYCASELTLWTDAEGAVDWVASLLPDPTPTVPEGGDGTEEEYLNLFADVLEKAQSMQDEEDGDMEEGDDDEEDMEEGDYDDEEEGSEDEDN